MDITNKSVRVSRRIQEIEHKLSCKDLTIWDINSLRYELHELKELDYCINAYFKLRNENEALIQIAETSFKYKPLSKQAQKAWHDLQVIKKSKGE